MNALQKLRQTVTEIQRATGGASLNEQWALAGRLLSRMSSASGEINRICTAKDAAALDAMVASLETQASGPPTAAPTISEKDLDAAMNAFKKRIKLTRLADESKLGGRQLSGGRKSEIDGIIPPTEYPREVWEALARNGKIKKLGEGFYGPV